MVEMAGKAEMVEMVEMADLTVRLLTPDDWEAYRDIRLTMLQDSPGAFATRYADAACRDAAAWRGVLGDCDHHLAEQAGRPVGAAGLRAVGGRADLIGMWVAPTHRGSTAGAMLVAAVVDRARACGQQRLLLDVVEGNVRARRFYERLGFRPTGRVQPVPGREEAREAQMELLLAP